MLKEKQVSFKVSSHEYDTIHTIAQTCGKTLSSFLLEFIHEQIENWEDEQDIKEVLNNNEPGISWKTLSKENSA
jgi:predicted DNA-binding protein